MYFLFSSHASNICLMQKRTVVLYTCSPLVCLFLASRLTNASGLLLIPLCLECKQAYICDHHYNYQTEF